MSRGKEDGEKIFGSGCKNKREETNKPNAVPHRGVKREKNYSFVSYFLR